MIHINIIAPTLQFSDFAIIACIVIVCAGVAAYTTRQPVGLRRLERKLDSLLKHQGVPSPPILSEEVQRLASDPARKTDAITLHRDQTSLGLLDAKSDVEEFIKTIR